MKPIAKNELYEHLNGFLKDRGVHLTAGSYAEGIQKGCSLLTDAINLSQKGLKRAKAGINESLEQMRQTIHEQTAPKKNSGPAKAAGAKTKPRVKKAKAKRAKR